MIIKNKKIDEKVFTNFKYYVKMHENNRSS